MKRISPGTRNVLIVFAAFLIPILVLQWLPKQPFYVVALIYAVVFVLLFLAFRHDLLALRGNVAYLRGDHDTAAVLFKRLITKKIKSPIAYYNYANMLLRDGDAEAALDCLLRAKEMNPTPMIRKNIIMTLGTCHWVRRDIDMAIETLEGMRDEYDFINENVLTTLGYMYLLKGDFEQAHKLTDLALAEAPAYAAAWDNRGQICYEQGDMAGAKEAFDKALLYKPTLVDSLYFMGVICEREGEDEAAQAYFARAKDAPITALNTVTTAQIMDKLR